MFSIYHVNVPHLGLQEYGITEYSLYNNELYRNEKYFLAWPGTIHGIPLYAPIEDEV